MIPGKLMRMQAGLEVGLSGRESGDKWGDKGAKVGPLIARLRALQPLTGRPIGTSKFKNLDFANKCI